MADKQVRIVISATDSFSAVVNKYSQAMGQATADTKRFDQATQGSGAGIDNLASAVGSAIKGFIAFRAVGMAGEMISLGNAANATHATFVALSGDVTTATATLNSLRAATGGIVTDIDLMSGANRLLAMNIATSGQQAAELSAVAVNLGRAFGQEAGPAIENFSLMIANQSLLRLDSLGISAAAVRERMKELANEFPNMDKQARFTQATLEQATVTVDRLGTSIQAAQTPVAQLATSFENLKTTLGQGFANVVNTAITSVDQLLEIGKMQAGTSDIQLAAKERAQAFVNTYFDEMSAQMDAQGIASGSNRDLLANVMAEAWLEVEKNPDLMFDQTGMIVQALDQSLANIPGELRPKFYDAIYNVFQAREIDTLAATAAQENAAAYNRSFNDAMTQHYGGIGGVGMGGGEADPYAGLRSFFEGGNSGVLNEFAAAQEAVDKFQQNAGGLGTFIDSSTMNGITEQFEKLKQLNDDGLITDDTLSKAEAFRDRAQEAADAFTNMSLTDIFGQTSGGMEGEIGDLVIKRMKDAGASPEAIAAAEREFNLGSGRETSSSIAMETVVAPMIADLAQTDPALAQQAVENVNAFLLVAGTMNLTPDQITAGLQGGATGMMPAAGGGVGGTGFSVKPGQTLSEISAQTGIPVAQLLAATGASSANLVQPGNYNMGSPLAPTPGFDPAMFAQGLQGNVDQNVAGQESPFDMAAVASDKIKDNTADIVDQVEQIATGADAVTKAFDMAAAPRIMQITVETIDKTGGLLKAILGGLTPGTIQLGTSTRDAGGRVAGVDGRVGQKPGLTK